MAYDFYGRSYLVKSDILIVLLIKIIKSEVFARFPLKSLETRHLDQAERPRSNSEAFLAQKSLAHNDRA